MPRRRARGRRAFEDQLVEDALLLVERLVDALELVVGHDIGRHALLDLAEALVVGLLEGLEGAHEVAEGIGDAVPVSALVSIVCQSWGTPLG